MDFTLCKSIELMCYKHNVELTGTQRLSLNYSNVIEVEPCYDCLSDAKDEERNG
jgi:hypothetical protein